MLFNSIEFILFLPIVSIIFFILPHKFRWAWLLLASCYFYISFTPYYILLLLSVVIVDYFMGIFIENSRKKGNIGPKIFLAIGIIFPLIILFIFKYFNFFNDAVKELSHLLHLNYSPKILNLILPIGISFYTFQSISYVIDVYRGTQKAEKHFGIFALFVAFFPQLVAGPIERPENMLHQFYEKQSYDYKRVTDGLKLMAWGFFKKLVIADRVAFVVNEVYNHPHDYWGIYFILATFFFAVQIYCDFSGYSDIAIGSAKVMGFKLMDNFKRPYFSQTMSEFWKRWHISLSTWFRDYLYIPLGGSRTAKWRWQYNLVITFLISGVWHGANWTFIFWGALHVLFILIGIWTGNIRKKIIQTIRLNKLPRTYTVIRISVIFLMVCFAWIFFRANSLTDAFYITQHLFTGVGDLLSAIITLDNERIKTLTDIARGNTILGFSRETYRAEMTIALFSILLMGIFHFLQERGSIKEMLSKKPVLVRWSIYCILILSILFFGVFSSEQFIYFQF